MRDDQIRHPVRSLQTRKLLGNGSAASTAKGISRSKLNASVRTVTDKWKIKTADEAANPKGPPDKGDQGKAVGISKIEKPKVHFSIKNLRNLVV